MSNFWIIPAPTQEEQGPTHPTEEPSDWRTVPTIASLAHPQSILKFHGKGINPFDFRPGTPYHTSISCPQGAVLMDSNMFVTLPDLAVITSKTSDTSNTSQSQNVGGQEVVPYIASIPPKMSDTSNTSQSQNVGGQEVVPYIASIPPKTSDTSNTSQSQNVGGQEVVPYIASIPPKKPDTSNTNQSQNVGGQECVCDGSE